MPIDPRAEAAERNVAPAPLPHVSRNALKRVLNPVPAPTACRYCGGEVRLVRNAEIYFGRAYGEWPYAYLCIGCRAYVGLHPDTDIPLGTLANKELRAARNQSKSAFHAYMKAQGLRRTAAYQWLATQMAIAADECHFGWFEMADCAKAEAVLALAKKTTSMAHAFQRAQR